MTIWNLTFGVCIQLSIWMVKQRIKLVLASNEPWMQEHEPNKFHTIVSEVSSFVGILRTKVGYGSFWKINNYKRLITNQIKLSSF